MKWKTIQRLYLIGVAISSAYLVYKSGDSLRHLIILCSAGGTCALLIGENEIAIMVNKEEGVEDDD